jgi:uncharacterized phage protein (predicted DNA packaging)
MLVSEVTITDLKAYANVYHDEDDLLFESILIGAKHFIKNYTGKPINDLDSLGEDITIALYILSNEMYDNRMVSTDSKKVSFVVKQILDSHSYNLL